MLRKLRVALVTLLSVAHGVQAQPMGIEAEAPAPRKDIRALQEEGHRIAEKLLDGRTIVVRIYPDAESDPQRFETLGIPLAGDTIRFNAIKEQRPSVSRSTLILAWAPDQRDEAVARVLGRHVFAGRYYEQRESSLWDLVSSRRNLEPAWTFFDARGEPIPEATIDITLITGTVGIPLGQATLDERGTTARWFSQGTFVLKVAHPAYGAALVEYALSEEEPSGNYVVPLVPHEAPEAALRAQGLVVDSDGAPVAGAVASCTEVVRPDGTHERPCEAIRSRAVSDEQGWFGLCLPTVTKDFELKDIPPAGTRYYLHVRPPRGSSLRQTDMHTPTTVLAGARQTFTLSRMDAEEFFHTFAFAYQEGPVTRREELTQITLSLFRDDRLQQRLTYDQWRDGCPLPPGVLRATTNRWGESFSFQEIVLTAESPERLLFTACPPIIYRGRVVDDDTGEPIQGAFALAGHPLGSADRSALTDDQWQELHREAMQQAHDDMPQAPYRWRERVIMTDADGVYETMFMPGHNRELSSFTILAPGYFRASAYAGESLKMVDGVREVPTERLRPQKSPGYRPVFIFEDETGPVTDLDKLRQIKMEICRGNMTHLPRYDDLVSGRWGFVPGIYNAEVVWGDKYCIFEPLDLTTARPKTVVFRPAEIRPAEVTYTGQVIHGITGRPIPGVFVLTRTTADARRDISSLGADQWDALEALEPSIEPTEPAVAPLLNIFTRAPHSEVLPCVVRTDAAGRFTVPKQRSKYSLGESVLAVARDFLVTQQQLELIGWPKDPRTGKPPRQRWEPDDNGIVTLPPLQLFPAGTVCIHPIVPDSGHDNRRQWLSLHWSLPGDNQPGWVRDLCAVPRDNYGAHAVYAHRLRPNATQTRYLPAGVDLGLVLVLQPRSPLTPAYLGTIRLVQGQVLDLGRVKFPPGVEVVVKVADSRGAPVDGVMVGCMDEAGVRWSYGNVTGTDGTVGIHVPVQSSGTFRVGYVDREAGRFIEETIPYRVAGPEDAGREFVLRLSDKFLKELREVR